MLSLMTTGQTQQLSLSGNVQQGAQQGVNSAANAFAQSATSSFLDGLKNKVSSLFGNNQDGIRKARVAWMLEAAQHGSVLAAQIIYGAPDNVAGNEDPYWLSAASTLQTGDALSRSTWEAAVNRGKSWPVGVPFDMPAQRASILNELDALGQKGPTGTITGGGNTSSGIPGSLQTTAGNTVQTVGSQIVNGIANAVNPNGNYATIPTSMNTLIGIGVLVIVGVLVFRKSE